MQFPVWIIWFVLYIPWPVSGVTLVEIQPEVMFLWGCESDLTSDQLISVNSKDEATVCACRGMHDVHIMSTYGKETVILMMLLKSLKFTVKLNKKQVCAIVCRVIASSVVEMSSSSCLRKGLWPLRRQSFFPAATHGTMCWLLILTTAQTGDEDVGWLPGLWGLPGVRLCSDFTFGFHQAARRGLDANKR